MAVRKALPTEAAEMSETNVMPWTHSPTCPVPLVVVTRKDERSKPASGSTQPARFMTTLGTGLWTAAAAAW